ncbi:HTTM domain-containing protein [Rubellicoccus peritrichatus]|uniref:HTTM-like domain-containing protein n=1 Tax=Rubellicoccus peritrichatus TaxID=3080537 RepID=A0AAQ3L8Y4_9BACT|nr:HTTM domain-containing protein [Puniceicoccus sp. CR14]WOO40119.1 hypothetical protein RZN69_15975 [Puniceicoccus sp. CR14]
MDSKISGGTISKIAAIFAFDLRSLAAFRIGLGVLILWDLVDRLPDLKAHYTDAGLFPRSLLDDAFWNFGWHWSLHSLSGELWLQIVLFCLAGLTGLALLCGWKTRWATLVSWILLCSLHARNPAVLHGGDALLRQLLFFSIFLPLGTKWSFDSKSNNKQSSNQLVFNLASMALVLQVSSVYWFSLYFKSDPMWTDTFEAIWYTLNYEFIAKPLGVWLTQFPEALRMLTIGTLALEAVGPLVVMLSWRKPWLRFAAICLFWVFHLGIWSTVAIGSFSAVCIIAWLPLIPGSIWEYLGKNQATDRKPTTPVLSGGIPSQLIPGIAILLILSWNASLADKGGDSEILPNWFKTVVRTPMLNQRWMAFSNEKGIRWSGWMVIEGTDTSGRHWDLIDGRELSDREKPESLYNRFPSERWRKGVRHYLSPKVSDEDKRLFSRFFRNILENEAIKNNPISKVRVLYYVRWIEPHDQEASETYHEYEFFAHSFEPQDSV